jgi:cation transport ATPase
MPRKDRDDRDDRDEDEERPKLQSLAQAARTNHLKQIRGTLLAIGILTLIFNVIAIFAVPAQIRQELAKQGPLPNAPGMPEAQTILFVVAYMFIAAGIVVGLLFILFGALVHMFPVPITIASLVLYVLVTVVCFFTNLGVESIVWTVIRVMFIIALAKAVNTALTYQREQRAQLATAEGEIEDEDEYD